MKERHKTTPLLTAAMIAKVLNTTPDAVREIIDRRKIVAVASADGVLIYEKAQAFEIEKILWVTMQLDYHDKHGAFFKECGRWKYGAGKQPHQIHGLFGAVRASRQAVQ